jgi:hypothetical protein
MKIDWTTEYGSNRRLGDAHGRAGAGPIRLVVWEPDDVSPRGEIHLNYRGETVASVQFKGDMHRGKELADYLATWWTQYGPLAKK